ncbi:MAG: hypothetical protein H6745_02325 [Deltaproteobacteria bacterium]|nr:hypothetical protein [Deltaproteobacteria bacterium]
MAREPAHIGVVALRADGAPLAGAGVVASAATRDGEPTQVVGRTDALGRAGLEVTPGRPAR